MGSLKTHIGAPFSIVSQGIRPESKREFSERQGANQTVFQEVYLHVHKPAVSSLVTSTGSREKQELSEERLPRGKPGLTKHKAITTLFQRQNWGWAQRSVSLRSSQVLLQPLAHSHLRRSNSTKLAEQGLSEVERILELVLISCLVYG